MDKSELDSATTTKVDRNVINNSDKYGYGSSAAVPGTNLTGGGDTKAEQKITSSNAWSSSISGVDARVQEGGSTLPEVNSDNLSFMSPGQDTISLGGGLKKPRINANGQQADTSGLGYTKPEWSTENPNEKPTFLNRGHFYQHDDGEKGDSSFMDHRGSYFTTDKQYHETPATNMIGSGDASAIPGAVTTGAGVGGASSLYERQQQELSTQQRGDLHAPGPLVSGGGSGLYGSEAAIDNGEKSSSASAGVKPPPGLSATVPGSDDSVVSQQPQRQQKHDAAVEEIKGNIPTGSAAGGRGAGGTTAEGLAAPPGLTNTFSPFATTIGSDEAAVPGGYAQQNQHRNAVAHDARVEQTRGIPAMANATGADASASGIGSTVPGADVTGLKTDYRGSGYSGGDEQQQRQQQGEVTHISSSYDADVASVPASTSEREVNGKGWSNLGGDYSFPNNNTQMDVDNKENQNKENISSLAGGGNLNIPNKSGFHFQTEGGNLKMPTSGPDPTSNKQKQQQFKYPQQKIEAVCGANSTYSTRVKIVRTGYVLFRL